MSQGLLFCWDLNAVFTWEMFPDKGQGWGSAFQVSHRTPIFSHPPYTEARTHPQAEGSRETGTGEAPRTTEKAGRPCGGRPGQVLDSQQV